MIWTGVQGVAGADGLRYGIHTPAHTPVHTKTRLTAGFCMNGLAMAYFPQGAAPQVSSALRRFTSVFGMGTGGATAL